MTPSLFAAISFREQLDPHMERPLAVLDAIMKQSIDVPPATFVSAILSDVLEEELCSLEELRGFAGEGVAEGISKLTRSSKNLTLSSIF